MTLDFLRVGMLAIALFSTDIIVQIWQLNAFLLLLDLCHKILVDPQGEGEILRLTQRFIQQGDW